MTRFKSQSARAVSHYLPVQPPGQRQVAGPSIPPLMSLSSSLRAICSSSQTPARPPARPHPQPHLRDPPAGYVRFTPIAPRRARHRFGRQDGVELVGVQQSPFEHEIADRPSRWRSIPWRLPPSPHNRCTGSRPWPSRCCDRAAAGASGIRRHAVDASCPQDLRRLVAESSTRATRSTRSPASSRSARAVRPRTPSRSWCRSRIT